MPAVEPIGHAGEVRIEAPSRVAVTGVGIVAPGATGMAEFWTALLDPVVPMSVPQP